MRWGKHTSSALVKDREGNPDRRQFMQMIDPSMKNTISTTQSLFLFSVALAIKHIQMPTFWVYRTSLPTALRSSHCATDLTARNCLHFANGFELGKAPMLWSKTCLGRMRENVSWHHTHWARSNWSTPPVDTGTHYELLGRETCHAIILAIHWFKAQRWETT